MELEHPGDARSRERNRLPARTAATFHRTDSLEGTHGSIAIDTNVEFLNSVSQELY